MANNIIGKGTVGPQGEQGEQGVQGVQGASGIDGTNGTNGIDGVDGQDGAQGATGPKGDTGEKGDKGDKGDTGDTGATGAQGPQGLSGVIPSTAETITSTTIDWSVDATYVKSITTDTSFSFTNVSDGMVLSVVITADTTDREAIFPIGLKWSNEIEITTIAASTATIFTFIAANSTVYVTYSEGYV